jgi:aerotolerance-related protein batD
MSVKGVILVLSVLVSSIFPLSSSGKGKEALSPFLESRVEREKVVEGERLIYEVVLYVPEANVAGVETVVAPGFSSLPHTQSSPDSGFGRASKDGKDYYTAVIDRYFVGFNEKGKFPVKGGRYRVGINHPVQVNDPFWGPSVRNRMEVVELRAPDVAVKVSALPDKGKPDSFTGAVGDFQINAALPSGNIRAGEDAYMVVSISGDGDLTDSALPEIRKTFPEGVQFKSMTDSRTHYVKNGRLGSELEIEVVFHPKKSGTFTIDGLEFTFYNSRLGKYETAVAPPLVIEVEESIPGKDGSSTIMDI